MGWGPKNDTAKVRIQTILGDTEGKYVWAGGVLVDGEWRWNDGSPIDGYTNWDTAARQPDNPGHEHFLCLKVSNGKWHSCTAKYKYSIVCERREPEPASCAAISDSDFSSVAAMQAVGWDVTFSNAMSSNSKFAKKCTLLFV